MTNVACVAREGPCPAHVNNPVTELICTGKPKRSVLPTSTFKPTAASAERRTMRFIALGTITVELFGPATVP